MKKFNVNDRVVWIGHVDYGDEGVVIRTGDTDFGVRWDDGYYYKYDYDVLGRLVEPLGESAVQMKEFEAVKLLLSLGYTISKNPTTMLNVLNQA